MSANVRNKQDGGRQNQDGNANQPTSQTHHNPTSQINNQREWDSDTEHQGQKNQQWKDSQSQHQNPQRSGEGGGGSHYENDRNQDPTRRGVNREEE